MLQIEHFSLNKTLSEVFINYLTIPKYTNTDHKAK